MAELNCLYERRQQLLALLIRLESQAVEFPDVIGFRQIILCLPPAQQNLVERKPLWRALRGLGWLATNNFPHREFNIG